MKYEEMTVKELREESKSRGLTLEHKGHKFTKPELIERLCKCDDDLWGDVNEDETEHTESESEIQNQQETVETAQEEAKIEKIEQETNIEGDSNRKHIYFAETFKEIVEKYSGRKPQHIYDNELKVGCMVVFIHYVQARDGEVYKRLRTAKVIEIDRDRETVKIEMLSGDTLEVIFEELLYIKSLNERNYPYDIHKYIKQKRTARGIEFINERFGNGNKGQC